MNSPSLKTRSGGISIFLKLFGIYIATVVVVTVLSMVFLQAIFYSGKSDKSIRDKNRAKYVSLLVEELGNPPRLDAAMALSRKLDMHIRMEGSTGGWTTWDSLPAISELDSKNFRPTTEPHTRFGKIRNQRFTVAERNGHTFLFLFQGGPFREARVELIPVLLALVGGLFALSFLWLRYIFKPLHWLTEGVSQVAQGNLDHGVAVRGNDELGELASSFNDMTRRIRDMMKSKEQLLLDVSHELRSPLTRIKVALELNKPNGQVVIRRNIIEMETMISELLESARLDSGHGGLRLEPVALRPLLEEAVGLFPATAPGIRIHSNTEALSIHADRNSSLTVFRNLLENAVKYSSHQDKPVELSSEAFADKVKVHVVDYGYGIPETELKSIFEPFYRVDKSRTKSTGGYGLGLSLCRKIMEAHGGAIVLESREGEGTRVTLEFPLSHDLNPFRNPTEKDIAA